MKKRSKVQVVMALVLSVIMISSVFMGCTKSTVNEKIKDDAKVKYNNSYPLNTDQKLTYWAGNDTVHKDYQSYKEQPFYKELMKRTGVEVEFIMPPAGQHREAFNLLIASNDLPDVIQYDWLLLPGGPEKYIKDNYIIKLNDIMDKYAPNLSKYLKDNPNQDKMIKTDNKEYYAFPSLRGDEYLNVWAGPVVRKDWLDELGLPIPETMDDWYRMLKAFKNKKQATAPLAWTEWLFEWSGAFTGAYGVMKDFYIENGKVVYGPAEPGWKDFLQTFKKWYEEGLIDPDIATIDGKMIETRIVSGQTGAVIGSGGSMGTYLPALKSNNPKADLIGVPYPVLNKGEKPKFGQRDNDYLGIASAAITTKCKDVELAARFLDYGYSEEGHMLFNFGIEGESYQMVDGYPKYTHEILNDFSKAYRYIRIFVTIHDPRMYEQRMVYQQQKDALKIWINTDMVKYKAPPLTPTSEESQEMASLMNEITTYTNEMMLKFMFGNENIDKFDDYVKTLKTMGIDKVLKMKQDSLERYQSR